MLETHRQRAHPCGKDEGAGFGSSSAIGINSVADLANAHDSAVNSTLLNYDVDNNPGINCT